MAFTPPVQLNDTVELVNVEPGAGLVSCAFCETGCVVAVSV